MKRWISSMPLWRRRLLLAIVYILLLLGFAFGYWCLPGREFYHANVSRELTVIEYKNRFIKQIGKELQDAIAKSFQDHHGGNQGMIDNWRIDSNTFQVLFPEATEKDNDVEFSFKLDIKLSDTSGSHKSLFIDPIVTFSATEDAENATGDEVNKTFIVDVPEVPYWPKDKNDHFIEAVFSIPSASMTRNSGYARQENHSVALPAVRMPISKHLDNKILDLAQGMLGDPSKMEGHCWRMLYLSAVTITTLGYGDIMPLSTRARFMISLESIFGIVVIGFFISPGSPKKPESLPVGPASAPDSPDVPSQ